MIKAKATGANGEPIIILGLTRVNLERLQEGKPMRINNAEFDLPGVTYIIFGEDEQTITDELGKLMKIPTPAREDQN